MLLLTDSSLRRTSTTTREFRSLPFSMAMAASSLPTLPAMCWSRISTTKSLILTRSWRPRARQSTVDTTRVRICHANRAAKMSPTKRMPIPWPDATVCVRRTALQRIAAQLSKRQRRQLSPTFIRRNWTARCAPAATVRQKIHFWIITMRKILATRRRRATTPNATSSMDASILASWLRMRYWPQITSWSSRRSSQ